MEQLTDQDRATIVNRYRESGETQEAFCFFLEVTDGIHVAPRTLRAWCKRFGQPQVSSDECIQSVIEVVQNLQHLLATLQSAALTESAENPFPIVAAPPIETNSPVTSNELDGPPSGDPGDQPSIMDVLNTVMDGPSGGMPGPAVPNAEEVLTKPKKRRIQWDW